MNGNRVAEVWQQKDADYLRFVSGIDGNGRTPIGIGDLKDLAYEVATDRRRNQQPVARDVDGLARIFKGLQRFAAACDQDLKAHFCALAAPSFHTYQRAFGLNDKTCDGPPPD